jgi:hypothetical protein
MGRMMPPGFTDLQVAMLVEGAKALHRNDRGAYMEAVAAEAARVVDNAIVRAAIAKAQVQFR